MIRLARPAHAGFHSARTLPPLTARAKLLWTLGNTLMLVGLVLLLYMGSGNDSCPDSP